MSNLGFLTNITNEKCSYTFILDGSTSVDKDNFRLLVNCVVRLIKLLPKDCEISIILFSTQTTMIAEFTSDKVALENIIKESGWTNLKPAIELASHRINKFQEGIKSFIILFTDGEPSDDPTQEIDKSIRNGIEFFGIGIGEYAKSEKFKKLLPGQLLFMFDEYKSLNDCIANIVPSTIYNPLSYNIKATKKEIQRSTETLWIDFEIVSKSYKDTFKENEIVISILPNEFYQGVDVLVNAPVTSDTPFKVSIPLKVNNNAGSLSPPLFVYFNLKAKGHTYSGRFSLDFAWFVGDLVSKEYINILVEGFIGHGKSSILNLILNLFTSNHTIDEQFLVSRNGDHCTSTIDFTHIPLILQSKMNDPIPKAEIYKDIVEKTKITIIDKPGRIGSVPNINLSLAAKGCYRPNKARDNMKVYKARDRYACHAFIFVVSLASINLKNERDIVYNWIVESITQAKIQPILAITFSDNFTDEELVTGKQFVDQLPVPKDNVFYITPYIDGETKRIPAKDLIGWQLLKKAFTIGKRTCEAKFQKEASSNFFKSMKDSSFDKHKSKNNNNNNDDKQPTTTTTTTTTSSPTSTSTTTSSAPPPSQISSDPNSSTGGSNNTTTTQASSENSTPEVKSPPVSPSKPWKVTVTNGEKEKHFKVPPRTTVKELVSQVAKGFGLTPGFELMDDDECSLCESSSLDEVISDCSKLSISFN